MSHFDGPRPYFLLFPLLFFLLVLGGCGQGESPSISNGNLFFDQANYEEARKAYHQGLKELEKNPPFENKEIKFILFYNLGNCYFQLGDDKACAFYFQEAKKIKGGDPDLNYNLSLLLARMGKVEKAIELLKSYLSVRPDDYSARVNLSILEKYHTLFIKAPEKNHPQRTLYDFQREILRHHSGLIPLGHLFEP